MTSVFVLVHGFNSNSFSWAPLQRELTCSGTGSLPRQSGAVRVCGASLVLIAAAGLGRVVVVLGV